MSDTPTHAKQLLDKCYPDCTTLDDANRVIAKEKQALALWNSIPEHERDTFLKDAGFLPDEGKVAREIGLEMLNQLSGNSSSFDLDLDEPIDPPHYVCSGLGLAPGRPTMLCGASNNGKTPLAQYIALCVATGTPILGVTVERPGKVIHINWDASANTIKSVYQRIAKGNSLQLPKGNLSIEKPSWNLEDPKCKRELVNLLQGRSLCIIDSLRSGCPKANENDSSSANFVYQLVEVSEKTNCAILLLHHKGKGKAEGKDSSRGTSAFVGAIEAKADLLASENDDLSQKTYSLTFSRSPSGCRTKNLTYQMVDIPSNDYSDFHYWKFVSASPKDARYRVLGAIKDGAETQNAIREKAKVCKNSLPSILAQLENEKLIENWGNPKLSKWKVKGAQ